MTDRNKYLQMIPADRWFYAHPDANGGEVVYPVACWALTADELIIGLIAADTPTTPGNVARLVEPPPVGGRYYRVDAENEA